MSAFPESDIPKTGPAKDVPVPDRAAEFRQHVKAFGELVRRVLDDCDLTNAMEQEWNKRRNGAGQ